MGKEYSVSKKKHPWCHRAPVINKVARYQIKTGKSYLGALKNKIRANKHFKNNSELHRMVIEWTDAIQDGRGSKDVLLAIAKGETQCP